MKKDAANEKDCWACLSEMYRRYLDMCVPENCDPGGLSIQDLHFRSRKMERFRLLQVGDGTSFDQVYVETQDGQEVWIQRTDLVIVEGSLRSVKRKGLIHMGRSSLMGSIAYGIRSGRVFRAREDEAGYQEREGEGIAP
jgi:hypothetical protein